MKTKTLLFFCMLLGILFVSAAHNSVAYEEVCTEIREIPLEGSTPNDRRPRFDVAPIITAEQQGDMLFVRFQRTAGTVQVTITDEYGGEVFTETVNAAMQPSLTISLMGLPSGSYVITFSNENLKLWGEFEI